MWQVAVYRPGQHEQFAPAGDQFVLSRAAADDRWTLSDGDRRPLTATAVRVRAEADRLWVECRGVDGWLYLADGAERDPRDLVVLEAPSTFRIDDAWFDVRPGATAAALGLEPLHEPPSIGSAPDHTPTEVVGPDAETIAGWLTAVGRLHRTAASSPEFFATAARLTLQCTGLDAAMVVVREGRWEIAGSAVEQPEHGACFETAALSLLDERPEAWRGAPPAATTDAPRSARLRESIIVAPVLADSGQPIAAVYGVRHGRGENRRRGIRPLEARVVELMADAVAAGMGRQRQEVEAARQQVLLEQAFSPAVAEHLRRHPEALAGQVRELTLLFADLRGFTALAESLSPADGYALLAELLDLLTTAVMDRGGVVIDYYGDGLCALWNAPLDVPKHADLACDAALEMLGALPALSARWRSRVGRPLELGVGVHAGEAWVGNAGAQRRLKYGPRGSAVNLASRVQGATRVLDVPLLLTDAVRRRLSARFTTLKTCTARLPGVEQPLDLFTVFPATDGPKLQSALSRYAAALNAFESGDLDAAEKLLAELLANGPATPAAFLAQQTAALRQSALGRRATDQLALTPDAVIEILAK